MRSLATKLMDFDTYKIGNLPTLKTVFDNLRCYSILIVFMAAAKVFVHSTSRIDIFIGYFLVILSSIICAAVVLQTSLLFSTITLAIFGIHTVKKSTDKDESNDAAKQTYSFWEKVGLAFASIFVVLIVATCVVSATSLFKFVSTYNVSVNISR